MISIIINSILAIINTALGVYNVCNGNNVGFFNIGVAIYCILLAIVIAVIERRR